MTLAQRTLLICCYVWPSFLQATPPSGCVIQWGWNTSSGDAAPAKNIVEDAVAVCAGTGHSLALKGDGAVVQWGSDFRGEAVFNNSALTVERRGSASGVEAKSRTTILTNGMVEIDGRVLSGIMSIAAGDEFSLGLKRDGTVIGWGENSPPIGSSNIIAIAANSFESLAVRNNGTVVQWVGFNGTSEHSYLTVVPDVGGVVAVAIGKSYHGTRHVALKRDGTVVRWGDQSVYNDETPPVGLSNVLAIAAGSNHTLALKNDGTVIGWGFNDAGQATGVATTNSPNIASGQVMVGGQVLSNVVSIAANHGYSMALKKDGTIVTWGRMVNNLYPATVPAGLTGVVAIAACENFCLAITTNAAVAEKFRQK